MVTPRQDLRFEYHLAAILMQMLRPCRTAQRMGIEYYFVEQDESQNPLASIRSSYQYLRTIVA
jgi:hypothetical protein